MSGARRMGVLAAAAFLALGPATPLASQVGPGEAEAVAAFLARMAGEWEVVTEVVVMPGTEPIRSRGRESARVLGGRWLIAEREGETPTGSPVESHMVLGFDRVRGHLEGSWVDALQGHLWRYSGRFDPDAGILELETEGPVLGNPELTTRYREVVEFRDDHHRVTRSSILGPDGAWFEYGRAEYARVRGGRFP